MLSAMSNPTTKIVFVAMSGGVDSSVAAALLKQRGFDVVGVFIKNWHSDYAKYQHHALSRCPWEEDEESARHAAAALGIPFYTWDFSNEYREKVVNYMVEGYARGETPNPDVMCNKTVKFGLFLDRAKKLGADYIATGHYARIASEEGSWKMLAGVDTNKDQSYFLWTLTQEQLEYCLFPVGEYTKPQVRNMAREFGLPNAARKDSQGLCFVGKVDFPRFLAEWLPERGGAVVTTSGDVVGAHRGAHLYTVGQRHGIGIGGGEPYFVAAKNVESNTLTVTRNTEDPALYARGVEVRDVNWISGPPAERFPLRCQARIRYRQPLQGCLVTRNYMNENTTEHENFCVDSCSFSCALRVSFEERQRAVALGQSVVFYDGEQMLGGGIIGWIHAHEKGY